MSRRIYFYDSTLRDGAQTSGVDFTSVDKQDIASHLDTLGIDYIEGGWPGANPTDDAFFADPPQLTHAKLAAFGMTRRPSTSVENDPGLSATLNSGAKHICIVGKSWDFHVSKALEISLDDNIAMIRDSIAHIVKQGREALFDAEHFFDGFKANREYALQVIEAAYEAGARWVVLCDTNGGSLPYEIEDIVSKVTDIVPGENLGIHCHNDTENAVANSLAAVRAGVCQIQGTINGVGERCGNANLISIIPTVILKMGLDSNIPTEKLQSLTKVSRFLDDRLNRAHDPFAPYVGNSAFAHKGGLHVSAVSKAPESYEHIAPESVGNRRSILISDQAGRSNIVARLEDIGLKIKDFSKDNIEALITEIKERESRGYAYDAADASFELLARQQLQDIPEYFKLILFRTINERRRDSHDHIVMSSEAAIRIIVKGEEIFTAAHGNGPVNALDQALRKALSGIYPEVQQIRLVDYKVRILDAKAATGAITRVLIESEDAQGERWTTIGVSENIIDASYNALRDSITYKLMRSNAKVAA